MSFTPDGYISIPEAVSRTVSDIDLSPETYAAATNKLRQALIDGGTDCCTCRVW